MGRLQPFPIVGGAYTDDAKSWANQDTVNFLPVRSEREGTLTAAKLEPAPGLRPFLKLGDGPVRGGRDVEGNGFVVSGSKLYRIAGDGVAQAVGTIPGTGPVTITHNQVTGGNQVVIGNGISGYVYDTSDGTLVQITDDGFPGFASLDFLGQMVLGVEPQRRYWFHSDLVDATGYNTNNRYSAETSPDRLVGVIAANNDAVVFGERTIEPWTLAPSANQSFQLQRGGVVEMGCAAARTLCRLDNSIFFLNNFGQVVQLSGYSPRIVSTRAMEGAISRCDLSRAFAFTWEDKGHAVYYITFPDGQTWGWDAAHGEWHRRKSYGMERWRLSCLFKLNGHWYGGDAFSGLLYRLTWRWAKEACDPVERIRRTGVVYQAAERFRVNRMLFELDSSATETVPYHWPDAAAPVTGALPALAIGAAVDYQYTVTPPPGRPFGMTVEGLPDGLTLHIDGRVTGTPTETGEFPITITAVDDCGVAAELEDAAGVTVAWLIVYPLTLSTSMKRSPDGEDWSSPGFLPAPAAWAPAAETQYARHGDGIFLATVSAAPGDYAVFSSDRGTTWNDTNLALDAAGGESFYAGGYWHCLAGVAQPFRSANGLAWAAVATSPGAVSIGTDHERLLCINASNWVYRAESAAGDAWERIDDLPDVGTLGALGGVRMGSSLGRIAVSGYRGDPPSVPTTLVHALYSTTDGGDTWDTHASPFPSLPLATGPDSRVCWFEGLGIWCVTFFDRLAYGPTLDDLTLSAHVFPQAIVNFDADDEKVMVCGANGMLEYSTDLEAWTQASNVPSADILAALPIGYPLEDA